MIGDDAHRAQVERDRRERAERAAMARELAAARKVVTDARFIVEHDRVWRDADHPMVHLRKSLVAYDAAVGKEAAQP